MSDRNGAVNGTDADEQPKRLGRRRLMQLAGVTTVGTTLASIRGSAATKYKNTITFTGTDSSVEASYSFGVTDGISPQDSVENSDEVAAASASGTVSGDSDAYDFNGSLSSLQVDGSVQVTIDYRDNTTKKTDGDLLEIVTPADGSVEYEFVTTSEPAKVTDNGKNSAEGNDTVTQNDDGTWTVTGLTGNGYGDAFDLTGDVTSFLPETGTYTLLLNGEEVTVDELTVDGGGDGSTTEPTPHLLEITTPSDGSVEYTFTASGEISKVLDNGDNSAEEQNDTVTQNDDGTWTATGLTGNGYGDTIEFVGDALEFTPVTGDFTLYLDGQEITVPDLTGQQVPSKTLKITTPTDGSVEYSLTTSGEISKVIDNSDDSAEEQNDTVTQNSDGTWTMTGLTGNGYGDTLEYEGEALDFSPMEGTFSLYLNGQLTTTYELLGEEPPSDGGSDGGSDDGSSSSTALIGGGDGYGRTVTRDDANLIARTASELEDSLAAASSGEVVFVPGDERVDLGWNSFDIPDGVTLASNRGVSGSEGALLFTDEDVDDTFYMYGTGRFTGIRLRGAHPGADTDGPSNTSGVKVRGDGELDNCRVSGFTYDGIGPENGSRVHIHHNVIVENNRSGLGYGVHVEDADPIIEYNYFNNNRHSVAMSEANGSYTCRYNHFGPQSIDHVIDVHQPGGVRFDIHNNVVETKYEDVNDRGSDEWENAVAQRGYADDLTLVEDNWFFNPNEPTSSTPGSWSYEAIIQPENDSWTNVTFRNNYYGEDANVTFSDIIPGYDGSRSN
ncbi:right-handed parallel beta-helix repeat-containing protein [Halorubellus sp. PRR65]|uniref:right-handed parallel beta-helix repeat-containing protein n=1 Tax=Halorubellus sp. PRR65 TaxID=3098148 RepID=UPI002B2613E8|nr:right-handed parallel beta-helix repeat-containing protein [Halorubellus sp. PRR65]